MSVTLLQQLALIGLMALGTALTRFAPFVLFPKNRPVPSIVRYLGSVLPYAMMGLLVVYCLKDSNPTTAPFALPELLAVAATAALYAWRKNLFLSIGGGTALYMCLIQWVFV